MRVATKKTNKSIITSTTKVMKELTEYLDDITNRIQRTNNPKLLRYGYCINDQARVVPYKEELDVIEEILEKKLKGFSVKNIVNQLDNKGITTKWGKCWRPKIINTIYDRHKSKVRLNAHRQLESASWIIRTKERLLEAISLNKKPEIKENQLYIVTYTYNGFKDVVSAFKDKTQAGKFIACQKEPKRHNIEVLDVV